MASARTWMLAGGLLALSTLAVAQGPDCKALCFADKKSPRCLQLSKTDARGGSLALVASALADKTRRVIFSSELRGWFDLKDDPCERENSIFDGSQWTNSGGACIVGAKIVILPGSNPIKVALHVPTHIAFSIDREDPFMILRPKTGTVFVQISDGDLHHDWGGRLKRVIATTDKAVFELPRGCLSVPLK